MKTFETQDLPLVGDAIYSIVSLLASQIMTAEQKEEIYSVLRERFIMQGFSEERADRVAKMISDAIKGEYGLKLVKG